MQVDCPREITIFNPISKASKIEDLVLSVIKEFWMDFLVVFLRESA